MSDILHTLILILHVLGATIIIGVAFVSLVIQLMPAQTKETIAILGQIWKVSGIALIIQILTGLLLAGSEWDKFGSNPLFWLKMFLIFVVGTVIGNLSSRKAAQASQQAGQQGSQAAKGSNFLAWAGLVTFALVAGLGVIIMEIAAG